MTRIKSISVIVSLICLLISSVFFLTACNPQQAEEAVSKVVYTVSYNANGGTGTMDSDLEIIGKYTLPANEFVAPTNKQFKCWLVGEDEKVVGSKITVSANTEVKAIWEDIPTITVTPKMLKVDYTQTALLVGETVDQSKVFIKCIYSDGSEEDVNIDNVTFLMDDYDITDQIDQPIPVEGVYDITARYQGLEAGFRIVAYRDYGSILTMSSQGNDNIIEVNFSNMRSDEDLDAIFSPSMENIGIRMEDSGLTLAYNWDGSVQGASIIDDGAWIRFRAPNFKYNKYAIEFTVDTRYMEEGTQVRFHGSEAVNWVGDFVTVTKSLTPTIIKYEFTKDNDGKIVITVFTNGVQTIQVISTATVEDFIGGTSNQMEGICWAVYDFNDTSYIGGAVITSMKLIESELN